MIRCRLATLAMVAARRGRSLDEVRPCIVEESGDHVVVDETHDAYPRPRGLGDYVAAGLSAVGITKERVSAAIGRPCLCAERQAALNEIGRKYLGLPTGTRG